MTPIKAIVTDIEGTTSSIAFVREVLFPYARNALPAFISTHHADPEVSAWLRRIAEETGASANDLDTLTEILIGWIDQDRKHTALKALQGLVWVDGYQQGTYKAPVYSDAVDSLKAWQSKGIPLYVYSSGSVPAQKLFFSHTDHGNLLPLFSGHFDTEMGEKRSVESYRQIANAIGCAPEGLLFLSDIVEELDAAREAGWQTVLVDRIEDYPLPRNGDAGNGHARATSFNTINVV
jgi:enolase-phosphatase E1